MKTQFGFSCLPSATNVTIIQQVTIFAIGGKHNFNFLQVLIHRPTFFMYINVGGWGEYLVTMATLTVLHHIIVPLAIPTPTLLSIVEKSLNRIIANVQIVYLLFLCCISNRLGGNIPLILYIQICYCRRSINVVLFSRI